MSHWGRRLALGFLCGALVSGVSEAQPYYSLQGGSGEQFQHENGPWPMQAATTGGSAMAPIGTGTRFPPLLIPKNIDPGKALVRQTNGPDPKQITIPLAALRRPAPGPTFHGVAHDQPHLFQVRTNLGFTAPALAAGSAKLRAGGRTG